LDLVGVGLLTSAIGIAIAVLLHRPSSPVHLAAVLLVGVAFLAGFAAQQSRRAQPILDPAVFAQPAMIGIAILLFAVSIGYWSVLVYLPLFLGAACGSSPEAAGVALLAATAPMLVLPPLGSRLIVRYGWRRHFAAGLAIIAAGNVALAGGSLGTDAMMRLVLILGGMIGIGSGAALVHSQLSGAAVALAPPGQAGMASAATVVMRQAGFAIGIAALGALLPANAAAGSYIGLFWAASAACACGLVAALRLLPTRH
jgi:predicted MFS family arabinose efflux permease